MPIIWKTKTFDELSTQELYQILRLRSEVFVVEQNCVYQDIDNKDQKALHLFGEFEDGSYKFPAPKIETKKTNILYQ